MSCEKQEIELRFSDTSRRCKVGDAVGQKGMADSKTPVLSCEGACIRGEIARQAANHVAKQAGYGRACHGELLSVPSSAIARWVKTAEKVVLIDGCFLRCHGRILSEILPAEQLVHFDALKVYKKYSDVFDPDDVPVEEREATARQVAEHVLDSLEKGLQSDAGAPAQAGCCS